VTVSRITFPNSANDGTPRSDTIRLPWSIFNTRIRTLILDFFQGLGRDIRREGWPWEEVVQDGDTFRANGIEVAVTGAFEDGAFRDLELRMNGVPSIETVNGRNVVKRTHHIMAFSLPRTYPDGISKVDLYLRTPLYHPRVSSSSNMPMCYKVNGEIDRLLTDGVYNILFHPARLRPPTLFPTYDSGYNPTAMRWYERYGPERLYGELWNEWGYTLEAGHPGYGDGTGGATPLDNASRVSLIQDDDEHRQPPGTGGVRLLR